jgi:cyclopropane fatty-acyl-phospholipid synthase-like methyltransferase
MDAISSEPVEFHLGGETGHLYLSEKVFQPNLTTKMLAESADIRPGDTVLELGCGVGPLAIYAAKKGAGKVYAVDIMPGACEMARRNVELNGVQDVVTVLNGSLFEPVKDLKFDVIIDDVSGMSEEVSRISPWYPDEIPSGGVDGTEPTVNMLNEAREHLTENGRLYFPLITLSDWKKSIAKAREVFGSTVEQVGEKLIPFCDEFKACMPRMEELKAMDLVDFTQRRSRYLWSLWIYRASMA